MRRTAGRSLNQSMPGYRRCFGSKTGRRMLIIRSKDIRSSLAAKIVAGGYNLLHLHQSEFSLDDIYQRYFQEKEGEYEEDGASEDKSARA